MPYRFYLLLVGDYESKNIVPLMKEMFAFIADFNGDVLGAAAKDHRKLSGHEPSDGKLYGKKISDLGSEKYYRKQLVYPVLLYEPEMGAKHTIH